MKRVIVSALVALLFASCAKESLDSGAPSNRIGFGAYSEKATTRAAGVTNSADLASAGGFIVNSYTHTADFPSSGVLNHYMQSLGVTNSGTGWTYSPDYYWPASDKVSFFAHNKPSAAVTLTHTQGSTVSGYYPTLTFTQSGDPATHFDLLTASVKDRAKGSGVVEMSFSHVLSRIGFKYAADVKTGTTITVTSAKLTGYNTLHNKGTYTYGTVAGNEWSTTSVDGTPATEAVIGSFTTATPTDYLFMVPQNSGSSLKLELEYTVSTADAALPGGKFEYNVTKTIDIPAAVWAAGKSYTYNFTISPMEAVFNEVTVGGWELPPPMITVNPSEIEIPIVGTGTPSTYSFDITVVSPYESLPFTVSTASTWLTFSMNADGTGAGTSITIPDPKGTITLYLFASHNPTTPARPATITVNGQSVTVTQAGAAIFNGHKGWAGSNIYWDETLDNGDGTFGRLTFDDKTVTTRRQTVGLYFIWGSLVALSSQGNWAPMAYTGPGMQGTTGHILYIPNPDPGTNGNWDPSDQAQTAWGYLPRMGWGTVTPDQPWGNLSSRPNGGSSAVNIPYPTSLNTATLQRSWHFAYQYHNKDLNIGDICKHLTEMGWAPGANEIPRRKWRMPVSIEFGSSVGIYNFAGSPDMGLEQRVTRYDGIFNIDRYINFPANQLAQSASRLLGFVPLTERTYTIPVESATTSRGL